MLKHSSRVLYPFEHSFAIISAPCMRTGRAVAAGAEVSDFDLKSQPGEESPNTTGQRAR
jgi:hypothetical protein